MAYTMAEGGAKEKVFPKRGKAGIAQLVEQLICNQQVVGSNPTAGSSKFGLRISDSRLN